MVDSVRYCLLVSMHTDVAPSKKRRGGAGYSTDRDTLAVYHKLTVVLGDIAHLVESHPLTDATILNVRYFNIQYSQSLVLVSQYFTVLKYIAHMEVHTVRLV